MNRDERIAFLERGINSPLTPDHLRLEMQETLSELLKPEAPPPPPKPKRAPVVRKPKPEPKVEAPKPPAPREISASEAESMEEEYIRRRNRTPIPE